MSPVLSLTTSKLLLSVLRYSKTAKQPRQEAYRTDWYRQDHLPCYDRGSLDDLAGVAILSDN